MIEIAIPGYKQLALEHLVLDFNGTLAEDGRLLDGARERLETLVKRLRIHILTADTFGRAGQELDGLPCELFILPAELQGKGKRDYVQGLGSDRAVAIGNGRNDRLMLQEAALAVAVVMKEGASREALLAADVICPDILSALDLLINPLRLVATLRT